LSSYEASGIQRRCAKTDGKETRRRAISSSFDHVIRRGAHYCTGHIRIQFVLNVFTVGPSCLITDSIFKAIEYKQQLEAWNQRNKERKALVDEMTIHNKGKDAAAKAKYTKADYEIMLRWKMGVNAFKNEEKGQKVDALKNLWEHYKDVLLESIVLPEEEDEPSVSAIQNTALGDASTDLLEGAANPWINNSRRDRLIKLCELIDDKLNEGGDDISIN
jgi:hypothetical protein